MSSGKTYPLFASPFSRELVGGVTHQLAPSDVPVAFDVRVHDRETLAIAFVYAHAAEEPLTWTRMESVDLAVGQHSRRLFEIRLTGRSVSQISKALHRALELLRERTYQGGPRMNYAVAGAGLGVQQMDVPPPWLIDAVAVLRGSEGPGSGSGRHT